MDNNDQNTTIGLRHRPSNTGCDDRRTSSKSMGCAPYRPNSTKTGTQTHTHTENKIMQQHTACDSHRDDEDVRVMDASDEDEKEFSTNISPRSDSPSPVLGAPIPPPQGEGTRCDAPRRGTRAGVHKTRFKRRVLFVKRDKTVSHFLGRDEYRYCTKIVVATHRGIAVRGDDIYLRNVKERGDIDALIGEYKEELGCEELLALEEEAKEIASQLTSDANGSTMVVVAYTKKGLHGAHLLAKLASKLIATAGSVDSPTRAQLDDPSEWIYRELWDVLKKTEVGDMRRVIESWYHAADQASLVKSQNRSGAL